MTYWCATQTHKNAEDLSVQHLVRQGFKVLLPKYLKRRKHARKIDWVPRPLFPRYLFVELVSERMGEVQGLRDRGKHRLRSVLLTLSNYGYEIDDYSKEGNGDLELSASSLEQLESSLDGRTILFRRAASFNASGN